MVDVVLMIVFGVLWVCVVCCVCCVVVCVVCCVWVCEVALLYVLWGGRRIHTRINRVEWMGVWLMMFCWLYSEFVRVCVVG